MPSEKQTKELKELLEEVYEDLNNNIKPHKPWYTKTRILLKELKND